MIQYTLKCEKEHTFDSWFQSSSAFEKLKASKMVVCSICGSSNIDKAIMTPRVNKNKKINAKDKLEGFIDRNQTSAIKVLTWTN